MINKDIKLSYDQFINGWYGILLPEYQKGWKEFIKKRDEINKMLKLDDEKIINLTKRQMAKFVEISCEERVSDAEAVNECNCYLGIIVRAKEAYSELDEITKKYSKKFDDLLVELVS